MADVIQPRSKARKALGTVRFSDSERAIIDAARGDIEPAVFVRAAALQWARYLLDAQRATPVQKWAAVASDEALFDMGATMHAAIEQARQDEQAEDERRQPDYGSDDGADRSDEDGIPF